MTLGYNSLDEKTKSLIPRVFKLVEFQISEGYLNTAFPQIMSGDIK